MFKSVFKYCFLTAVRDYFYLGLIALIVIFTALSIFLGDLYNSEKIESTIVYIAASFRIILAFGISTFICLHIKNMYDQRTIDFIFSKNVSRPIFVLSYWLSFVLISLFLLIPLAGIFAFFLHQNLIGLLNWTASMMFEIMVVIAFAMTASLILRNFLLALTATYMFYFTARIMGFFVAIRDVSMIHHNTTYSGAMHYIMSAISIFLPRLDLFANSEWLIYSDIGIKMKEILLLHAHALLYITILLGISFYDMKRKEFD